MPREGAVHGDGIIGVVQVDLVILGDLAVVVGKLQVALIHVDTVADAGAGGRVFIDLALRDTADGLAYQRDAAAAARLRLVFRNGGVVDIHHAAGIDPDGAAGFRGDVLFKGGIVYVHRNVRGAAGSHGIVQRGNDGDAAAVDGFVFGDQVMRHIRVLEAHVYTHVVARAAMDVNAAAVAARGVPVDVAAQEGNFHVQPCRGRSGAVLARAQVYAAAGGTGFVIADRRHAQRNVYVLLAGIFGVHRNAAAARACRIIIDIHLRHIELCGIIAGGGVVEIQAAAVALGGVLINVGLVERIGLCGVAAVRISVDVDAAAVGAGGLVFIERRRAYGNGFCAAGDIHTAALVALVIVHEAAGHIQRAVGNIDRGL